jgi:hypothetical protein
MALTVLSLSCTPTPKFQEFRSEIGGFSIKTPVPLIETTQAVDAKAHQLVLHLFSGAQGGKWYGVAYTDYPADFVVHSDPERMLDGSREGIVDKINGRLVKETRVALGSYRGRELIIAARAVDGQDTILRAHLFLVANRLYQTMVIVSRAQEGNREVTHFLDSFQLLRP